MLYVLVLAVYVLVCLFLILVVLLQSGKSGDIASAFGGAGTQTMFGPRGTTTVLSRATTWSAAIFMVGAILLVILSQSGRGGSVVSAPGTARPAPAKSSPAPAPPSAPKGGSTAPAAPTPAPAAPASAPAPEQPKK